MNIIYDTVKTVIVYLILVAIVMNLLGTSSYKKYVAMFTGMLLIYIVITPILKLLNISDSMDYHFEENYFKAEAQDVSSYLNAADEEQNQLIIKEYKEKIKLQINESLSYKNLTMKDCKIELDEDTSSETFGSILAISLYAEEHSNNSKEPTSNLIEKIHIEEVKIGNAQKEEQGNTQDNLHTDSVLEIEIKKELADLYQMNTKDISVKIEY